MHKLGLNICIYFLKNFGTTQFKLKSCPRFVSGSVLSCKRHWVHILPMNSHWCYKLMICELILASIRVLGPCSPINQPFTLCGNETGPPVGTSYLLGASIHLLLSIHTLSWHFLIKLVVSLPAMTGRLAPFPACCMMSVTHGCWT